MFPHSFAVIVFDTSMDYFIMKKASGLIKGLSTFTVIRVSYLYEFSNM